MELISATVISQSFIGFRLQHNLINWYFKFVLQDNRINHGNTSVNIFNDSNQKISKRKAINFFAGSYQYFLCVMCFFLSPKIRIMRGPLFYACHPQSESIELRSCRFHYLFAHNKALVVFPISWPSVYWN